MNPYIGNYKKDDIFIYFEGIYLKEFLGFELSLLRKEEENCLGKWEIESGGDWGLG